MATETELKLRVASHDPVRERLMALGARSLGRVVETNVILDGREGPLRSRGCGLRVRSTVDDGGASAGATLTYKGPRAAGVLKVREELEVSVTNADTTLQILAKLGFAPILQYEKRRESWQLGSCRVELDEPPHLGLFVEIEGPDEAAILSCRNDLGLGAAEAVAQSYVAMLVAYCDERGIMSRTIGLG
ncbi:MAG: class IV adenylate cyclase [Planctomycetes bacterium]|nr:class IV adenylate cyclase [Planctomycetota bacterium]